MRSTLVIAGFVLVAAAGCGDDSSSSSIPDSFYDGLEDGLLEEGAPEDLASCVVDAVRKLDLTAADVTEFEETGDFSAELSNELDGLTAGCFGE